ncbi:MAG TPA: prepilin-type N-terminal cleavage/methylation domain-containing protein [Anaerohalosphaeraceae bacterium]|mgnify:FL=1|nr:prepilin-type N-terminal cleavage/methylation domain-containing protein [Anaerohalosphaeraceae bacterium]HPC64580.1 prepilin-type N-terminal cleavage/methylation domain-containing protein [Anaerohalosphaeraceae bacterium]HRS71618.1 prepilin-type N-terminal cleavage/methylation domain-containing protein [Anaerohalosphaeraceae bacterium]HRV20770.1 prepilin-type N-terminal cleavage/methylation domain-containing protein [Anaerohalosphaeraceae bacterium]
MRKQNTNRQNRTRGFTLVELMIITAILGILAAIVFPEFQGHIQRAKETQAKANLRLLREAIERYAADHNGIPPGYLNNDPSATVSASEFYRQLVVKGKYLNEMPKNPFNGYNGMFICANIVPFPAEADGTSGWIYKPLTKEIRLNWPDTDSEGKLFYSY